VKLYLRYLLSYNLQLRIILLQDSTLGEILISDVVDLITEL